MSAWPTVGHAWINHHPIIATSKVRRGHDPSTAVPSFPSPRILLALALPRVSVVCCLSFVSLTRTSSRILCAHHAHYSLHLPPVYRLLHQSLLPLLLRTRRKLYQPALVAYFPPLAWGKLSTSVCVNAAAHRYKALLSCPVCVAIVDWSSPASTSFLRRLCIHTLLYFQQKSQHCHLECNSTQQLIAIDN